MAAKRRLKCDQNEVYTFLKKFEKGVDTSWECVYNTSSRREQGNTKTLSEAT